MLCNMNIHTFSLTTELFSNKTVSMLLKLPYAWFRSAKSYEVCKNVVTDIRKSITGSPSPGYHSVVLCRLLNREFSVFAAVTWILSYPNVFLRNCKLIMYIFRMYTCIVCIWVYIRVLEISGLGIYSVDNVL